MGIGAVPELSQAEALLHFNCETARRIYIKRIRMMPFRGQDFLSVSFANEITITYFCRLNT